MYDTLDSDLFVYCCHLGRCSYAAISLIKSKKEKSRLCMINEIVGALAVLADNNYLPLLHKGKANARSSGPVANE